jgi:hypothetical protein
MNRPEALPQLVQAGLKRCASAERQAWDMPRGSNEEWAARADRLAEICERRARWWVVLARWVYRNQAVPPVLGLAAVVAEVSEREHARSWREMAGDWRRRATQGDCCNVIGGCRCLGDDWIGVA